ncbi:MAG: GAF domain-containing sensor histidine kinase [Bacteroidota bacterium]
MIEPAALPDEDKRFEALKQYDILDSLPEKEYDQITFLASYICDTPICLITLIDDKRQWIKSTLGLDVKETSRELAFCSHAIHSAEEILEVEDARNDPRFEKNPFVLDDPNIVFYAGAPLSTPDGYALGTLCVIDTKPKVLSDDQKKALKMLADHVMTLLDLRKKKSKLERLNDEIRTTNEELDKFAYGLSHDLQTPARGILRLLEWIESDHAQNFENELSETFELIKSRALYMHNLIDGVMRYAKSKRTEIRFEYFNPGELLTEVAQRCVGNEVRIVHADTHVSIYHSKVALKVCLQNLLSNSLKYSNKKECEVLFKLEEDDIQYVLLFQDNGPGISKEYFEKVFEIYETLNPKSEESTGIGLSTTKAILAKAGGSIRLINNGPGACFQIKLPKRIPA